MTTIVFSDEGPLSYFSPVSSVTGVPVVTDVTADEYLSFAKSDIAAGTAHGAINALGNAKRALHLMIDTLLQNYGLLVRNPVNFPAKLELLDRVGLIALSVFKRLNIERNLTEHEYVAPPIERVQDFIDVCHLLQLALERLGQEIPYQVIAGLRETGEHVLLVLEPLLGQLDVYPLVDPEVHTQNVFGGSIDYVMTVFRGSNAACVPDTPSRSIELRARAADEWAPIIGALVNHQGRASRVSRIEHGLMTIWSSMTFPTAGFENTTLSDLFDMQVRPGGSGIATAPAARPTRQR